MIRLMVQDWFSATRAFFQFGSEQPFLFVPVCIAAGIIVYFSLNTEPSLQFILILLVGLAILLFFNRTSYPVSLVILGALLAVTGVGIAGLRTVIVKAPVLERDYRAVRIEAVVKRVEARPAKKWRLTLLPLKIGTLPAHKIPVYLRLSTRTKSAALLFPGQIIGFKAALFRPARPSVPEGYDFSRRSYFRQIGAVGFILSRITVLKGAYQQAGFLSSFPQYVSQLRQTITARIRGVLPGQEGAIAAALLTGERGGITQQLYDNIRNTGLAHLLAISGLHMAVMAGTLFWLVHMLLATSSVLALSYPIRKWAVVIAWFGATFYLFVSGAGIATQRAYIMLVVGFLAILLDRPALTLRNLALAACVILLFFPETVLEAGFQMSFATTAALIAFYEYRQGRRDKRTQPGGGNSFIQKVFRFFSGVFMTSFIAGLAVIPFAAFHFHQIAVYSLAGNMFVMPIFVFLVMPMALATLVLMPVGLDVLALKIMAVGLSWIIDISEYVASWEGAVFSFPIFPVSLLLLMTFGVIWLVLLKGTIRVIGLVPLLAGLVMALSAKGYDLLLDEKLQSIAYIDDRVEQAKPRYHLLGIKKKKSRLERWLKFSGRHYTKYSSQKATAQNSYRFICDREVCMFTVKNQKISVVKHPLALREECQSANIVILDFPLSDKAGSCKQPLLVITKTELRKKGAYGLNITGKQVQYVSVSDLTGKRPWSYKPPVWRKTTNNISKKHHHKRFYRTGYRKKNDRKSHWSYSRQK